MSCVTICAVVVRLVPFFVSVSCRGVDGAAEVGVDADDASCGGVSTLSIVICSTVFVVVSLCCCFVEAVFGRAGCVVVVCVAA